MSRIKFVVEQEEGTLIENQINHSPKLPQQTSVANLEFASNVNEQDSGSGLNPLSTIKKPFSLVPLTLEEKKERQREYSRLRYLKKKANPVDPEIRAEKLRRSAEYQRKRRQQLLANSTPEQLEQMRLKDLEKVRRHLKKETEEHRKRRLELVRQYSQKRKQQLLANGTPELREQRRLDGLEKVRRRLEKETEEQRLRRLEQMRQYYKQRMEQQWQTMTPEEREKKRAIYRENYYRSKNRKKKKESLKESMEFGQTSTSSSMNLVVDNCESSHTSQTSNQHLYQYFSNDNNGMEQIDPEQQQGSLLDHSGFAPVCIDVQPTTTVSLETPTVMTEPYSVFGDLDPRTEVPISTTVDSDPGKEVSFSVSVPVPMVDSVPGTEVPFSISFPTVDYGSRTVTFSVSFSVPVSTIDSVPGTTEVPSTEPRKLTQLDNSTFTDTPTLTTTIISTDLESSVSLNPSILTNTANNLVPSQNGALVPASLPTVPTDDIQLAKQPPSLPLPPPDGASTSWWQSYHSTFNDDDMVTLELDVEPGREEDESSSAPPDGATKLSEYNSNSMSMEVNNRENETEVNQEQQSEEEKVLAVNLETEVEVAVKPKRCTRSVKIPNEMVVERKQQPKKRLVKFTPNQREHRKIVERNRLLKELSTPETRQAILERWRREREKPLLWPYNLVNRKRSVKETAALDLNRTTILKKNESETTTD